MLLLNTARRKAGGNVVTDSLTSNWLESRITWKPGCTVRRGAVAKVLLVSNSVAAYPTARAR